MNIVPSIFVVLKQKISVGVYVIVEDNINVVPVFVVLKRKICWRDVRPVQIVQGIFMRDWWKNPKTATKEHMFLPAGTNREMGKTEAT